jgi:POT family proton-dependent oligopeptide transporter
MNLDTWLVYLLAATGLSLSPGPNGLLALTHGALHGPRQAWFTIAGGACLFMAALTQPESGKIGLFWPFLFHLLNSIGFAHILPISLALFTKIAPKQITATVIGLYYLAFFAANKTVGYVGGLYSSLPTTTFWLLHVASAGVGLVAFVLFKMIIGHRMESTLQDQAAALS